MLTYKNKTILTLLRRANNTESLIDYIIADYSLANDTLICDSIVERDHIAILCILGLRVESRCQFKKKTIENHNVASFKHCLDNKTDKKVRKEQFEF